MFRRLKRVIYLVAAVTIFLAGFVLGKGVCVPVAEADAAWEQSVENAIDLQAAADYVREILPELKEADGEELKQLVLGFLEKFLEGG